MIRGQRLKRGILRQLGEQGQAVTEHLHALTGFRDERADCQVVQGKGIGSHHQLGLLYGFQHLQRYSNLNETLAFATKSVRLIKVSVLFVCKLRIFKFRQVARSCMSLHHISDWAKLSIRAIVVS